MTRRRLAIVVAVVVALNVAVLAGGWLNRSEVVKGPTGSSYVTTPAGVAAWYELLSRGGTVVRRLRAPVDDTALAGVGTFVIVEPGFAAYGGDEVAALRRFAEGGGTVVVAGRIASGFLDSLVGFDPDWNPAGATELVPWGAPPGSPDLLRADGFGSWGHPGPALPVLGADRPVALVVGVGAGTVHLVADPSVFTNAHLGTDGNARFAAAVAARGPVVFDEYRHGFADTSHALPPAWRRTWPLLAIVVLLGLYTAGRRLVPPQETLRDLGPERRRYVEALAALLLRSGDATAVVEPLRAEAQRLVVDQAGLSAAADPGRISAAARRLGLDSQAVEAIMDGDRDETTLEALARSVAALRSPMHTRGEPR